MSREELVWAFSERRISRRVFIAGMVAAGVSLMTAWSYAIALDGRSQGRGRPGDDYYDLYGSEYPSVPRGKGPPPGRPPHGDNPPGQPPSGSPPGSAPPGGGRGRPHRP
jgi:hypothetical protein